MSQGLLIWLFFWGSWFSVRIIKKFYILYCGRKNKKPNN